MTKLNNKRISNALYAFYAIVIIYILSVSLSCGHQRPMLGNEDKPFIVTKIKIDNREQGFATYYNTIETGYVSNTRNFFAPSRATITLPSGIYNIGDTIR